MKKISVLAMFLVILTVCTALSEEKTESDKPVVMEGIEVTGTRVELSPLKTEVFIEDYSMAGQPTNVMDILKDRASIDFRGQSDLVPQDDVIQMRGFDTRQFLTAVDGLVIQKTGGFWGDHNVDFGVIPYSIVESIEIISGPHSVLYDGKSIGGVINFKTKLPKYYETPSFDGEISGSLRSYNTNNQTVQGDGGNKNLSMGFSYERYHTDGYLRNNAADIDTMVGRLAYKLPSGGYMRLTGTYNDIEREIPSANDPARKDYDSSYPVVKTADAEARWQNPNDHCRRDYGGNTMRFDFQQPSDFGKFSVGAYYTDEEQEYHRNGFDYSGYDTNYVSYGGVLKHEIELLEKHRITTGFDTVQLYTKYTQEVVETYAGFIQDRWTIIPRLTLTAGLRYEDIAIWWNNWWDPSAKYPNGAYKDPAHPEKQVERDYHQLVPKSLLTYQLDDLAQSLRDTSVSLGVSKIWTPRSYCEVCSWGSGVEMDPAEGVGYDLILSRRLWKDIFLNVDFSRYDFSDYPIWANAATDYFKKSLWGRRMISLEDVEKDGIDIEINGHLLKNLGFYVSYSFNEWKYKGPHNGGPEEWADQDLSDRAKHRLNAGLRYRLFEKTLLLLDYKYQSKQVQQLTEMVNDDPSDLFIKEVSLDSFDVFDFAVEQVLFTEWNKLKKGTLKLYVNNVLDEEYSNSRGYLMTDRTFGAALSFKF
ncbi:MAG: TonB-dependent receptor [Proteobacteria bacterium]|nr:TonB-dependent receptor [Pseudomonadota bacterium]